MKPEVRVAPKVYDAHNAPLDPGISFVGEVSKTRQSDKDACDINKIMAMYDKTGLLPPAGAEGLFLDVSEMGDYRSAVEQVLYAQKFFAALPAKVRTQFANDPATFLDFCADPDNRDELIELGLLERPPEGTPPAPPEPTPPEK